MTRRLIICFAIFLSACGQSSQPSELIPTENKQVTIDSSQPFSIAKATANDFNKAKKIFIEKIIYDTTTYKKTNGAIKLRVKENRKPFIIFTDTLLDTDDSNVRKYRYVGQFAKVGFYIVKGNFWEHYEYYLIDKITGRQTTIWGSPAISPNDKFIADLSMTYGLEGVPNGIQIWRIDRQKNNQAGPIKIVKHLELDQQIWAPDDFVWETDNSLILRVAAIEKFMNENGRPNKKDFYFLKLKIHQRHEE